MASKQPESSSSNSNNDKYLKNQLVVDKPVLNNSYPSILTGDQLTAALHDFHKNHNLKDEQYVKPKNN